MKLNFILILFTVFGCNLPSQEIIGTWINKRNQQIEFRKDGIFVYKLDTNGNGFKNEIRQKYSTLIINDTDFIIMTHTFSGTFIFSDTAKYKIVNNNLYLPTIQEIIDTNGNRVSKTIPYNDIYSKE